MAGRVFSQVVMFLGYSRPKEKIIIMSVEYLKISKKRKESNSKELCRSMAGGVLSQVVMFLGYSRPKEKIIIMSVEYC